MRLELVYTPGCASYSKYRNLLETIVAEERLPIVVELKEDSTVNKSCIVLDGIKLADSAHNCFDELESLIRGRWQEITHMKL